VSTFVAAACSLPPKHEYELAPGQAYTSNLETVLLIPINETADLPNGLEKGEEAVFRLVREYLQAQGLDVKTPKLAEFRRSWTAALDRAQRESMSQPADNVLREVDLTDLISGIAEDLEPEADLVAVPNMVIRDGELSSRSLRWDGVRRRVPITQPVKFSGTMTAASLHVAIFTADGRQVFSGYGGLDVLWRSNIRAVRSELIENRLEDEANLREGVCVGFHPYFGEGSSC
jgi:hypothetical protein